MNSPPGMVCGSLAVITAVTTTHGDNTLITTPSSCPHRTTYGQPQPTTEGTDADRPSATKIQGCSRRTLPSGMSFTSGDMKSHPSPQTGNPCLMPQPQELFRFTLLPGLTICLRSVCLFSVKKKKYTINIRAFMLDSAEEQQMVQMNLLCSKAAGIIP